MSKEKKEPKKRTRSSVVKIDQRTSDELFEEIMRRKIERKRKRDIRNNTIRISQIAILTEGKEKEEKLKFVDETKNFETRELKELDKNLDSDVSEVNDKQAEQEQIKSKVLPPSYISGITETIDITDIIKLTRKRTYKISILLGIFVILVCLLLFALLVGDKVDFNDVVVKNIIVNSYDSEQEIVNVAIEPSTKQSYCAISKSMVEDFESLEFIEVEGNLCNTELSRELFYVYFKNDKEIISDALELNNYVISYKIDDVFYVALGTQVDLSGELLAVGDVELTWQNDSGSLDLADNMYISSEVKKDDLVAVVDGKEIAKTTIYTTNVITKMPEEFDMNKEFLSCEYFSYEDAKLVDDILFDRIKKAGEGTRAGAVAAARFLTLEFPFRISYYFENGRVNNSGVHYVDGEGRYYHKGLYLDSSKYNDIKASFFGPKIWGCKMVSYEDDPPYYEPGGKYPNGLDCSGFVSWSLFNGGFDVGDYGAGQSEGKLDLTDYGEVKSVTYSLIKSGQIKVGDLFNIWGHISILVGQDDDYFYIAESLNTYKGVVVNKYSKKTVSNTFPYVVLMDKLYNGDGNLTDMWY